jgi:formamidopyrimidine-DNA glycosylase
MPEGPEVRRTAESLNKHLQGKQLLSCVMHLKSRYHKMGGFKGMEYLSFGMTVNKVYPIAKRIIFELQSLNGDIFYMISFLGMDGHWIQYPTKHTALAFNFGSIKGNFSIVEKSFYYDDTRMNMLHLKLISQSLIEKY